MFRWIALLLLVTSATSSLAQECADWTSTMPRPVEYPEIMAGQLLIVDDLLVSCRSARIEVYQLSNNFQVDLLGGLTLDQDPQRMRLIGGQVYLPSRDAGLYRLDLSDPASPSVELVIDPEPSS